MRTIKIALAATAALSMAAGLRPVPADPAVPAGPAELSERPVLDYDAARRDYEVRRERYERDRDRYDRRYGVGACAKRYGAPPAWDSAAWDANRYGVNTSYENRADFDRRAADYDRARRDYDRRWSRRL